jgi:pimeloyl-ACP methyl ester carboxylesterase
MNPKSAHSARAGENEGPVYCNHSIPERLSTPRLDRITTPTLIISASDDLFSTLPAVEFAAASIRGAKLVVYETGRHLLIGHRQDVRAVVDDFIAK